MAGAVLGSNFESEDLILAALFLWINLFLTARSAKEIAARTLSALFDFKAVRVALSSFTKINLLTSAFRFEPRRALLAVFVTGML